jgi:hypothetical protein
MKTITATVICDDNVSCYFILEEIDTGRKKKSYKRRTSFTVKDGVKYAMAILLHGEPKSKYKLLITGATKASYSSDELSISADGRGFQLARITG